MRDIVLIAHDIRSCHNVGSLLRTAEGLGITKVFLTGYTPYPATPTDTRLPHIATKLTNQIHKTALGAELTQPWEQSDTIDPVLDVLRADGYTLAGLEQTPDSAMLHTYQPPAKIAVLLGREVEGIEPEILKSLNTTLEIPMHGSKESFNVVQAAAMALHYLRFTQ